MTLAFTTKLAWRNIWRNKRRTLLTASAIGVAMLLALFTRSMQEGSYARNLDKSTRLFSGLLQLQQNGFAENKSIDYLISSGPEMVQRIDSIPGVTQRVPRIESFALAAHGKKSKGILVIGVDPKIEDTYSSLSHYVKQGRYFDSPNENVCLIGSGLAKYFEVTLGDEMVLYGQGHHGVTAAGVFKIKGILDTPSQQMNARLLYLPLHTAQNLFATGDQITEWVLHGENFKHIPELKKAAEARMPPDIVVRTWDQISPELAQQITMDRVSGQFMVFVLYGVVGFGVFATIVMMTLERSREFAVMLAAGMVRIKLQGLVIIESFFLGLIGVGLGLGTSIPLLIWFYFHPIPLTGNYAVMMEEIGWEPIIPFSLAPDLFITQTTIVVVILALCVIYPLVRIHYLRMAEALKR